MAKRLQFKDLIVSETEDYIFINKPAFIPSVHERGKITAAPLIELLRSEYPEATLCHRLDRETSGIILAAKNSAAYRHASIQFEKRKVEKTYHAIVHGRAYFKNTRIELPLNTDQVSNVHIDRRFGKETITEFTTLENFKHFSLVECRPVTGRLHQIRVHLASQNHPILNDELYGGVASTLAAIKNKLSGEDTPLMRRFALHALSLTIPIESGVISGTAEYSKDFEVCLKLISRYDSL